MTAYPMPLDANRAGRGNVLHTLLETTMNAILRSALAVAAVAVSAQAAAEVIFYERESFQGQSFTAKKQVGNLERFGFNDRASSVVVLDEPMGGLRRRQVPRPMHRFASRPVSVAGRDGLERPRFIGADREQQRAHR